MITKFIANGRSIKQPEIIQVTSGTYHNVLLDQDGRIYTFGGGLIPNANGGPHGYDKPTRVEGVLGSKYIVQISAGTLHTVVLDYKGNVYTFGDNRYGQLGHGDQVSRPLPTKIEGVCKI